MTRLNGRLSRLERQAQKVRLIMVWDDDEIVTDDNGERITAAEWMRRHPDAMSIQLDWGDENETDKQIDTPRANGGKDGR